MLCYCLIQHLYKIEKQQHEDLTYVYNNFTSSEEDKNYIQHIFFINHIDFCMSSEL